MGTISRTSQIEIRERITSFWLNLGFLDREMELSQRLQVLAALARQGIEVRANFNCLRSASPPKGIGKVWLLKPPLRGRIGALFLFFSQQYVLLKNADVDVVVVRAFNLHFTLPLWLMWRKLMRRPFPKFVLDVRTLPVDVETNLQGRLRVIRFWSSIRIASRHFDGLMMITEEMKNFLLGTKESSLRKSCVWTSGVNPSLFDPLRCGSMKTALQLEQKFVLIYHGVFSPNRGLQQAIKALALVQNTAPEIRLVLLGKGPAEEELVSLVLALGLEENVILHPPVRHGDVPKYINAADAGILPFPNLDWWNTSSPIKLFEYLAMGKPVIVTDIPAHRSVLNGCACGFFAQDNRPSTLAATILHAMESRKSFDRLGKEARNLALQRYSWDSQATKIREFFEKLIHGPAETSLCENRRVVCRPSQRHASSP